MTRAKNIIRPQKGSQELAMNIQADLIIYGGAAGCVDSETEFLSQEGWKKISEYTSKDEVMQYDLKTREASLVEPLEYIKKPSDGFYYLKAPRGLDQMVSPEHTIVYETSKGDLNTKSAEAFFKMHEETKLGTASKILTTYKYRGKSLGIPEELLRLYVALKADGSLITESTGRYVIRLKKDRKKERFEELLTNSGMEYTLRIEDTGYKVYTLYCKECTKFLDQFMFCSIEDAEIIADELRYWNSYFNPEGGRLPSYYSCTKSDADTAQYIFNILGYRASILEDDRVGNKQGKYTRKGVCYQVTPTKQTKLSLGRKAERKLEVPVVAGSEYKYCFTLPTGAFVARRNGHVFITGNSGKSHLLLMKSLPFIKDPNFHASYFRRNTKQLTQQGGLWEESKKMYKPFNISTNETDKKHTFKSGATIAYNHLEHEKHKESYQGGQLSAIFFDELTHFSETQFTYLLSRLRSDADMDGFCMASCNPKNDSWVLHWVEWWLDEEGYPDKEKQGIVRYYLLVDDKPVFADTAEELEDLYPELCRVLNPNSGEYVHIPPKTFTFIAGTIFDNQELIQKNPKYLADLNSLPRVEKARLLEGNWYAVPESEGYCKREWFLKADKVPFKARIVRAWDKASTEPSEVNRYPDFTASVKMFKDREGFYYITGDYCPENKDKVDPEVVGRFRRRPGERDQIIKKQAIWDGTDTIIVLPKDPGAAGQMEFTESAKKLIESGFIVKQDPAPSNNSKLTRFTPFASACENGLVYIVESTFDKKTLDYLYKELESFNGDRSTSAKKDDLCDSVASAFNYLSKQKVLPTFSLNTTNSQNKIASVKQSVGLGNKF